MSSAISQILPYAIGVTISPIPMIAVVMMLLSKRGGINGISYVLGSAVGLAAIGATVIALADPNATDAGGDPSDASSKLTVAVGLLLIALAGRSFRKWRSRPASAEGADLPKWMSSLDHITPLKAAALAVGLAFANVKNLLLTIAAANTIAQQTSTSSEETTALAVFVLVGIIGPAIPVGIYYSAGNAAPQKLEAMKTWLAINNHAIMAGLLLVIGAMVLLDGLAAF